MQRLWIVLFLILCVPQGIFALDSPLEERLQVLEERKGYIGHKKKFKCYAGGEFLYWKADIDGVAYATTSVFENGNGQAGLVNDDLKTRTPHFSYDPGFRVALGFQSEHDFFDLTLVWLRFYTSGSDHATGTPIPVIPEQGNKQIFDNIGLITPPLISISNASSAHCHFKGNVADLQLARGIPFSRHFFIRPFFGLRAVWSDLNWRIRIERDFVIPLFFAQDSTKLKVKNAFHAGGALIGLDIDWKCESGFGIVARSVGALVYGKSLERTKQEYTFLPVEAFIPLEQNFHARNSTHAVKGMLEIFAGIFWEVALSKARHAHLRLFAGYEFQQWPYFAQKTNTQLTRERERISVGFQGFNLGGGIVF